MAPRRSRWKIDGAWQNADTDAVEIDGWTTGLDSYIKIYTTDMARHNGVWDQGRYRIEASDHFGAINSREGYVEVSGLQIINNRNCVSEGRCAGFHAEDGIIKNLIISNNIIKKTENVNSAAVQCAGIYINTESLFDYLNVKIFNNIIYGYNYGLSLYSSDNDSFFIYNNTLANAFTSQLNLNMSGNNDSYYVKNNLLSGQSTGYTSYSSANSFISANNISFDATSPDTDFRNKIITFANAPAFDFHLSINDTAARGMGMDLSADAWITRAMGITRDIDGEERVGSWSIGADEFTGVRINTTEAAANAGKKGLVLHYTFDGKDMINPSGLLDHASTSLDRSGNANHGTVYGARKVSGKLGQGLSFDGVDDRIAIPNFQFPISNKMSYTQWINIQAASAGKPILSKWGGSQNSLLIKTDNSAADELKICVADGLTDDCANYATTTNANLAIGRWYHLVVVFNGEQAGNSGKLKLYINGSLAPLSFSGTMPSELQSSSAPLDIGGDSDAGGYVKSQLDDVRIYNYALTDAEIQSLYRAGQVQLSTSQEGNAKKGLVGYWSFNGPDISGATAFDRSGSGNNGTITGAVPVSGKYGQALEFDGVGDWVDVGLIDMSGPMSTCAWVKFNDLPVGGTSVISNHTNTAANSQYALASVSSSLKFQWDYMSVTEVYTTASGVLTTGKWYHVCGMRVSDNQARIFVDGTERSTTATGDVQVPTSFTANTAIGRAGDFDGAYLDGQIDEVRIYNYALSASEIRDLYNLGKVEVRK